MKSIRVGVTGAAGRMGIEVVRTVLNASDTDLVFAVEIPERAGQTLEGQIRLEGSLSEALEREHPDVVVDFTLPRAALQNAITCIEHGASPIIGTSGLLASDLALLKEACETHGTPGMVVHNFAIGAVLMMRFAELAARWLPDCEIVELHHNQKADAPSGTATRTAELVSAARRHEPVPDPTEVFKVEGARGGVHQGVPVHSVRLPGFLAHQEVLFGGPGEVLTIRHDSVNRACFMQGVLLAVRSVRQQQGLVMGLDRLLFAEP